MEQRLPVTLALGEDESKLLKFVMHSQRVGKDAALRLAVAREVRRVAAERARSGKPLPQWVADWLQRSDV